MTLRVLTATAAKLGLVPPTKVDLSLEQGIRRALSVLKDNGGSGAVWFKADNGWRPFGGKSFAPFALSADGKNYRVFVSTQAMRWGAPDPKSVSEGRKFVLQDLSSGLYSSPMPVLNGPLASVGLR